VDEIFDAASAVEQAVFGVQMQMDEVGWHRRRVSLVVGLIASTALDIDVIFATHPTYCVSNGIL
jgi:hypothetical protein